MAEGFLDLLGGGNTPNPRPVFAQRGSQDIFRFLREGAIRDPTDDPRLNRFLDKAMREIDKSFRGVQANFERSLTARGSGDAAAFSRDLAIAKSEQGSAALTDILEFMDRLRLESATGALQFLGAESQESRGLAEFELAGQAQKRRLALNTFQTVASFGTGGGGAPPSGPIN